MKRALAAAALALAMAATPGVAAAGPVWTVPQSITGESSASYPSISVAHNGTAMAVWRQSDGIGWSHWDGSTWSLAQVVGPAGATSPSIALSGDGTSALLAWDHGKQVEVSRWDGTLWTPPVSVSGASAGFPAPSALLDLDGDHPMVVWQMSAAGNYSLEYARWNGTVWTSAATVIATSSVIPGTASAMNDNGQAVAVFASPGLLSFTVSAMSWNGSTWSAPTDLIGLRMTPLTSQPAAAISSQGATSAGLWTTTMLAQSRVQAAVAGGSWPAPTDLVTGTEFAYPRIALSDDGTVTTGVWGPKPGVGQVQASVATNGTWGTTTTLENAADPFPDTAVSADGSLAAVTWNRHDGTVGSAWWSAGAWQPAATLAPRGQAKVGMGDEPGTAVAVWRATAGGVQAAGVATAPSPPTAVHATAGDGAASITWAAPAADGGRSVDSYHVSASPGGASCESATPACTVSGLTNGSTYSFTATATNAAGTSAQSEASNSVTPMAAPTPDVTPTPTPSTSPSLTTTTITGWKRTARTRRSKAVVRTTITPGQGRSVTVQRKSGKWTTLRTVTVSQRYAAVLKLRLAPGRYRLVVPATASATQVKTGVLRVRHVR